MLLSFAETVRKASLPFIAKEVKMSHMPTPKNPAWQEKKWQQTTPHGPVGLILSFSWALQEILRDQDSLSCHAVAPISERALADCSQEYWADDRSCPGNRISILATLHNSFPLGASSSNGSGGIGCWSSFRRQSRYRSCYWRKQPAEKRKKVCRCCPSMVRTTWQGW